MKKLEKKKILIILLIIIVLIVVVSIFIKKYKNKEKNNNENETSPEEFVTMLEDGTKFNTSEELKKVKKIDDIEIKNIQLTEKDGQTVLLADVTNLSQKDTDAIGIKIIILDKEGKEIATIPGAISPLKEGETKQLNVGITEDCANAYNFRVEKEQI